MGMKRPALWTAVWWTAGCAGAVWGLGPPGVLAWAAAIIGCAAGFLLRPVTNDGRRLAAKSFNRADWGWIGAAVLLLMAGNTAYHQAVVSDATSIRLPSGMEVREEEPYPVRVGGVITTPVEVDGDRAVFMLETDQWSWENGETLNLSGERIAVTVRLLKREEQETAARWRRGDRVSLEGTARRPDPASNYGGFDYRSYLFKKKIHWTLTVKGADGVLHGSGKGAGWALRLLRWNDAWREGAAGIIQRLFPGEEAGYMKGLLIGSREELDPERYREFSGLGLTHILAISGLHVAVFAWAVAAFLRSLRATRETAGKWLMASIPLYVLFTGASPSVVRAGLTAMAALWAAGRGWSRDALSFLGAAATAMLVWNPSFVTDVGFQLSFLVTAGLIAGVPLVMKLLPAGPPVIRSSLAVALASQCVSFPLTVFYFNQFSLLSLAANLILVPVISFVVTPLGYGALLAGLIWSRAGTAIALPVSWINRGTFWCVDRLDGLSWGRLIWPTPPVWWVAVYYGLAGGLLYCGWRYSQLQELEKNGVYLSVDGPGSLRRWRRALGAGGLLLLALLVWGYTPSRLAGGGTGTVSFLDVGQGDAAYIRTPGGKHILIDGGGTPLFRKPGEEWKNRRDPYEVGRRTVVPLLKKRGVHKLDYILVSHEDTDHIGGLTAVLEEIPVDAILFNGTLKRSPAAESMFKAALERGVRLVPVHEGTELVLDKRTTLTVLNPPLPEGMPGIGLVEDQNGSTVVGLLRMNGARFLFTGDIGNEEEARIMERLRNGSTEAAGLKPGLGTEARAITTGNEADIMKVAHHGSKNSSSPEWLAYWSPALSVISAGRNNIYGHPHRSVLERLAEAGSKVLRTDLQGEVQIAVEPTGLLRVRTKLQPP